MQALLPCHYERLRQLVSAYQRQHGREFKSSAKRNPRLVTDALCFRLFNSDELMGAWVTPVSLSLACVPVEQAALSPTTQGFKSQRLIELPSGCYRFIAEVLDTGDVVWRCELLDDLSDLESVSDAARLAQQLMDRVMTSKAGTSA